MPSTINADNGVVSGITGIRTTADNTGNLALQANGVTLLTVNTANNVTLGGSLKFSDGSTQATAAAGGPGTANVQSANFTAVSGFVYGVNTTAAAVTVTLPASPTAGNFLTVIDYARTFATNNCILARNGSNIAGTATNTTLGTNGTQVTLFYVDSTQGWLQASGSTNTFIGGYNVNFLAVAGGGGSGELGGGGGGGGVLPSSATVAPATAYTITIGAGGTGNQTSPGSGANTSAFGQIAIGGGLGAYYSGTAGNGGSGGGGGRSNTAGGSGTVGQGNNGGTGGFGGSAGRTGGGGGAGGAGGNSGSGFSGNGGAGLANSISGTSVTYASGGGGGADSGNTAGTASAGGGASGSNTNGATAGNGTANTGGGGGGGPAANGVGGSGGSGIFIISYPGAQRGTGGTITSSGGNTIHTFTSSGTYTA
jgi:hypothetical protein